MKRAVPEKSIAILKLMKSLDLMGQLSRVLSVSYLKLEGDLWHEGY